MTAGGIPCQLWSHQFPHTHTKTHTNYPDGGLGGHGNCRNPDGDLAPWCYTTDPDLAWDFCNVSAPSLAVCNHTAPAPKPPNITHIPLNKMVYSDAREHEHKVCAAHAPHGGCGALSRGKSGALLCGGARAGPRGCPLRPRRPPLASKRLLFALYRSRSRCTVHALPVTFYRSRSPVRRSPVRLLPFAYSHSVPICVVPRASFFTSTCRRARTSSRSSSSPSRAIQTSTSLSTLRSRRAPTSRLCRHAARAQLQCWVRWEACGEVGSAVSWRLSLDGANCVFAASHRFCSVSAQFLHSFSLVFSRVRRTRWASMFSRSAATITFSAARQGARRIACSRLACWATKQPPSGVDRM